MQYFYRAMKMLLTLICFFFILVSTAQQQRNFSSYTVDNGLAQNTVWDAFQDYRGYMWFGTADGVSRFDGYEMKQYKFRKDDSTTLFGNTIFKFYEDSNRNLWVSHDKGLSVYNRVGDCFYNIRKTNESDPGSDRYYTVLGEDMRGRVWCISGNNQLTAYSRDNLSFYKTITVSGSSHALSSIRTSVRSGKYIIGYLNDSSTTWFRLNTETETSEIVHGPAAFTGYFMLYNDSTICTFGGGNFYLYDVKSNTFSARPLRGAHIPRPLTAATSLVWWQGKILFGNNTGLYVFDPVSCSFDERIVSFNKTERVSFFYVQYLRLDHSGNLWVCTNGAGVKCLSPYQNKFGHFASPESRNTLVKAITTDGRGTIYTGLYGQGLVWYLPGGEMKQYKFGKKDSDLSSVLGMVYTGNHITMVNQRSLKVFDPATKAVLSETEIYVGTSKHDDVYTGYPVFRKYNGRLYLSADYAMYEISNGKPRRVFQHQFGDTLMTTFEIFSDTNWWIGTTKALFHYNPRSGHWIKLPVSIFVKTICRTASSHEVWVGGNTGLFRLSETGKMIRRYDISDGLPDDFIYGILDDKYGRLWMSHNKGMSVYLPASQTFKHYSVKDGLQSNEFNTGAYYKDKNGLLYFGGVNGVTVIDPDITIENKNAPRIGINEILLDDLPYQSDTAYNEVRTISVSYLQNTLSFDFSALEFSHPEKNAYRYKMEGIDQNWIESGTKHFVRYANLPPGSYTLKIMAANADGYWNEAAREIVINVTPPYWQTRWFYGIVFLVFVLVVISILYAILARQKAKLRRELELQQKLEDERLRISRDLHDNVGAQLSFLISNVEWMLQHPEQVNKAEEKQRLQALSETGRNAILTLRQTIWAISHSSLTVDDFADRFKQFALKMVEFNKGVQVHFTEQFESTRTLSPAVALNMFRICQEAFNNCLKHSRCSTILIRFANDSTQTFIFSITDDGVGFEWDEALNKGHYGLLNMKARAAETDAVLTIASATGKGTTLTLSIK